MPRKLRYTDEAIDDLRAILHWQTQRGSGLAGIRRVKAIQDAVKRIKQHPCLYPVGDHAGARELPCQGYSVMYELQPDTGRTEDAGDVFVLRVFGPGQDRSDL